MRARMNRLTHRKRILITGAAGNLGQKLQRHLQQRGVYEQVLLDRCADGKRNIIAAELQRPNQEWERHFASVDCVVHLAGDANPHASWPSLLGNNITATRNVLEAATVHKVPRV